MRKLLPLFALLLMLPLYAAAQDVSALDVCVLTPIAFGAVEEGGTPALYCGPTQGSYHFGEQTLDLSKPYVFFGQSDCWVTNDPLGEGGAPWDTTLARGRQGIVLAAFGDWLYVQTEIAGAPARVFIPAGAIL